MKENFLIVDDDQCIRFTFTSILKDAGSQLATADSFPRCTENMGAESFDLLFLDIKIGSDNGIEAIQGF